MDDRYPRAGKGVIASLHCYAILAPECENFMFEHECMSGCVCTCAFTNLHLLIGYFSHFSMNSLYEIFHKRQTCVALSFLVVGPK